MPSGGWGELFAPILARGFSVPHPSWVVVFAKQSSCQFVRRGAGTHRDHVSLRARKGLKARANRRDKSERYNQ